MGHKGNRNMKNLVSHLGVKVDRTRVLGIDPSTNSIAFTLVENEKPVIWGKVIFYRKASLPEKMNMMHHVIDVILEKTGEPTYVVVEQMISVQNPQTTRVLSYMAGAIMLEFAIRHIDIADCPPMTWKNYHGYKRVTKAMGLSKKEADRLRKSQIQDAIELVYPYFNVNDNDIADSCGIALWGAEISLKG